MANDKKKYKLVITPSIPVVDRHEIEKVLNDNGYFVYGGGTDLTNDSCDISFEEKE